MSDPTPDLMANLKVSLDKARTEREKVAPPRPTPTQPRHMLVCIDAGAAARLLPELKEAGYGDANRSGHLITFTADPRDAINVAEHAFTGGFAHDHAAAALIARL